MSHGRHFLYRSIAGCLPGVIVLAVGAILALALPQRTRREPVIDRGSSGPVIEGPTIGRAGLGEACCAGVGWTGDEREGTHFRDRRTHVVTTEVSE